MKYFFAEYVLDATDFEISRAGQKLELRPKCFDTLLYLIRHRDRVVGKRELLKEVWGTQFICSSAVPTCISEIRRILDEPNATEPLIRNVRGRGYQFAAKLFTEEAPLPLGAQDVAVQALADSTPAPQSAIDLRATLEQALDGSGRVVVLSPARRREALNERAIRRLAARAHERGAAVLVWVVGKSDASAALRAAGQRLLPDTEAISLGDAAAAQALDAAAV